VAAGQFAIDLEAVPSYMGRPAATHIRFRVEFMEPCYDFFQAQALFPEVNRLGSEVLGSTRQALPPAGTLKKMFPAHVFAKAESNREQLNRVLDSF